MYVKYDFTCLTGEVVRRTKEEALETRSLILDTAERVFSEGGVSRTSLSDIARAAGLTRGAIYWHFKDKADLFQAMIDRVVLPMEDMVRAAADDLAEDPLQRVQMACVNVLRKTTEVEQVRRVIGIAFFKGELDPELQCLSGRQHACRCEATLLFEKAFRNAVRLGQLPSDTDVQRATYGLMAYVDGLLYNWLQAPSSFDLHREASALVSTYFEGLTGVTGAADQRPAPSAIQAASVK